MKRQRRGRRVWRTIAVGGACLGAGLVMPAVASAAVGGTGHTVTTTETFRGTFDPELDGPNPCSGATIVSADAIGNGVVHETFFPAGDEAWGTFTETGKVTIVDDAGVTYTGHLTIWGNFNVNERNSNNTFTFTIMLNGSDGSTIAAHEVQHFALNANGTVTVDFDTMRLTCG
jgi:hypothetical protein